MLVYRISRQKFATDLSGTGARLFGGRWNSVGISMLYTSTSRSLATLEVLVHTTHNFVPNDLEMVTIKIPDTISKEEIKYKKIATQIKQHGIDARFQNIGDKWIKSNSSLLLMVPSVIIPEEMNVLINPFHAEFHKLKIIARKPFRFDVRLTIDD
jgi:RES domain-containing protein